MHFQGLNALNMPKKKGFLSSFEHISFSINKKYFKNIYDNLNYYVSFAIFQTYKNVILMRVYSLGWLVWSCFYLMCNSSCKEKFMVLILTF